MLRQLHIWEQLVRAVLSFPVCCFTFKVLTLLNILIWCCFWDAESASVLSLYLHFGQNGNHRYDDAENKVEADEELVFGTVVGFGVVEIKQHNCSKGESVMQDSEEQQTCRHRK